MLNRAIAILQMKIAGIDLSTVQTMTVTMRNMNLTIIKGNSDMEADDDILSISLTQEEIRSLNEGQFNIAISATNINGEDLSDRLKVIWVKRGNMPKFSGSSGDSGWDLSGYYTKPEVDALIGSIPKGQDGFPVSDNPTYQFPLDPIWGVTPSAPSSPFRPSFPSRTCAVVIPFLS